MVGIVLVSENKEASEMLKSAKRLLGGTKGIICVTLKPGTPTEEMEKMVRSGINEVKGRKGVLLLTDLYGSTQFNTCLKFVRKGTVEIVTGFNLPMLIKLAAMHQDSTLEDLSSFIEDYGRKQIKKICSRKQ